MGDGVPADLELPGPGGGADRPAGPRRSRRRRHRGPGPADLLRGLGAEHHRGLRERDGVVPCRDARSPTRSATNARSPTCCTSRRSTTWAMPSSPRASRWACGPPRCSNARAPCGTSPASRPSSSTRTARSAVASRACGSPTRRWPSRSASATSVRSSSSSSTRRGTAALRGDLDSRRVRGRRDHRRLRAGRSPVALRRPPLPRAGRALAWRRVAGRGGAPALGGTGATERVRPGPRLPGAAPRARRAGPMSSGPCTRPRGRAFPSETGHSPLGAWNSMLAFVEALYVSGFRDEVVALSPLVDRAMQVGPEWVALDGRLRRTRAGITAAAAGRWDDAERWFDEADERARQTGNELEVADLRRLRAQMLLDRSRPGRRGAGRRTAPPRPRRLRPLRDAELRRRGGADARREALPWSRFGDPVPAPMPSRPAALHAVPGPRTLPV